MKATKDDTCDVNIIGAGIIGICCALSIAEKGLSVRLIDRGEPGQATSFGNAGVISPWSIIPQAMPGIWKQIPSMLLKSDGPLAVKPTYFPKLISWGLRFLGNAHETQVRQNADAMEFLNHSNVELYRRHLAGTGYENLLIDSYYVHAFRNPKNADINGLGYAIRGEKGGNLEQINQSELKDLEPALSPEYKAAILIKGQARALSPGKIGKVLAKKAQESGVKIIKADVKSISSQNEHNWQVETNNRVYFSQKLVISAGPWSMKLLEPLGIKLPLEAERGYHLEYSDPGIELNNSVADAERMFVASSMEDGLRIAGTAEFAGIEEPPNEKRIESLRKLASSMLPDLNVQNYKTWMGIRPSFPDSLPVIDEFKNQRGLFAAFGHSHYGLMMAPKTGQIISDLVTSRPVNHDLSAYSTARF